MNTNYDALSDKEIRNLEARIRRRLIKKGYLLRKGKPNIYQAPSGYMIIDIYTHGVVYGWHPFYSLTLEDVVDIAFAE